MNPTDHDDDPGTDPAPAEVRRRWPDDAAPFVVGILLLAILVTGAMVGLSRRGDAPSEEQDDPTNAELDQAVTAEVGIGIGGGAGAHLTLGDLTVDIDGDAIEGRGRLSITRLGDPGPAGWLDGVGSAYTVRLDDARLVGTAQIRHTAPGDSPAPPEPGLNEGVDDDPSSPDRVAEQSLVLARRQPADDRWIMLGGEEGGPGSPVTADVAELGLFGLFDIDEGKAAQAALNRIIFSATSPRDEEGPECLEPPSPARSSVVAAGTPDSVAWCLDTSPAGTPQIRLINTTPTPTLVSVDPAGFGQVTTRLGRIVGSPSSDAGAGSSQPTPTGRATPLGSLEEMVLDLPSDLDNGMTIRASTEGTERLVVLEQVLDTWLFLTTGVDAAPPPDSLAARSIRLISESDCVGQEVGQEAAGLAGIAECLRPAIERSTPTSEPFVDSFDIAVGAVAKFAAETSPRRLEPNPWELTITRSGVPIYIADSAGLTRRVAEAVSPLVPAPGPVGRIDTSWDGTGVAWTGPRTSGGELKVVSSSTAGQIHVLPVGSEGAATGPSGFLTQAGNAESAAEVDSDGNQRRRATGLVGAEANLVGLNPGGDLVLIAPSGVVGRETVWISRDERPRNIGEVLAEGARFLSSQVGPDEPIWVAATSNPDSCTASSEIWRIDPSPGAVTRVSNAPLERSAPGTRFLLNDLRGLSNGRLIATWIERSSVCGSDPTAMWTIVYEGDSARVLATDLMQADVLDDGSLIGIVGRVTGVDGREAQAPGALVIRRPDGTEETVSTDATSFAIAPGRPIDHPLPDPGDVAPDTAREATPEESLVDLGRQLFDPRSHTGECRVNLPSPDTWCHGETDRTENEVRWLMRPSDVPDALPARARRNADGSWLSRVEQAIEVPPEVPSEPPPTTTAEPTAPRSLQLNPADRALVGVPFGSDAGTAILEMSRVIGPPDMDTGWRSCVANAAVDDTRTLTWGALAAEFERNPEDARFARWVLAVGTGSAGPDVASIELAGPANSITGSEPIASIAEGLGLELTDSGGLTWVRASDFTLSAPEPASRIDTIGAPDLSAC